MLRAFYLFVAVITFSAVLALPSPDGVSAKRQTSREEILRRNKLRSTRTHQRRADPSAVSCGSVVAGTSLNLQVSDGTYLIGGPNTVYLQSGGTAQDASVFYLDRTCNLVHSTGAVATITLTNDANYPSQYVQFGIDPSTTDSVMKCTAATDLSLTCIRVTNPFPVSDFSLFGTYLMLGGPKAGSITPTTVYAKALPP